MFYRYGLNPLLMFNGTVITEINQKAKADFVLFFKNIMDICLKQLLSHRGPSETGINPHQACSTDQMTGFYMECNTQLIWVKEFIIA